MKRAKLEAPKLTVPNFDRAVLIDVCKDGTISYRTRAKREGRLNNAALPVFSVNTVEEAMRLQVHFGAKQYTSHPEQPTRDWFVWPAFSGTIEQLDELTAAFTAFYDEHVDPERSPIEGSRWLHKSCQRVCVIVEVHPAMPHGSPTVEYRYEVTNGVSNSPANLRRNRNPTQTMSLVEWRKLFTKPAPEASSSARRRGKR